VFIKERNLAFIKKRDQLNKQKYAFSRSRFFYRFSKKKKKKSIKQSKNQFRFTIFNQQTKKYFPNKKNPQKTYKTPIFTFSVPSIRFFVEKKNKSFRGVVLCFKGCETYKQFVTRKKKIYQVCS
jgi:hypothetical protein